LERQFEEFKECKEFKEFEEFKEFKEFRTGSGAACDSVTSLFGSLF
jgi:hypothetical protein